MAGRETESKRNTIEFSPEEELTHFLLLNAPLMPDAGILNGKMKAVIHFFELSRKDKNEWFGDFALELIEEIHNGIDDKFPICFGHGLCGIGWGTEYLIKRQFLAIEEDVCAPYDGAVARYIRQERYEGLGLYNGLSGLLLYFLSRIENNSLSSAEKTLNENKKQIHALIGLMLNEASVKETERLFMETANADFEARRLFIYSKWEYPVVLRILGQAYRHGIRRGEIVQVLKRLLEPLGSDTPKEPVNRQILYRSLCYIQESEVKPLAAQVNGLTRKMMYPE